MTRLDLKLDLDLSSFREVKKLIRDRIISIKIVYNFKREYLPAISVTKVVKTSKGFHVYLSFYDKNINFNTETEKNLAILLIQTIFGSDLTRSVFDYLRVTSEDPYWNLLADYKNGKSFKEIPNYSTQLNEIIEKTLVY